MTLENEDGRATVNLSWYNMGSFTSRWLVDPGLATLRGSLDVVTDHVDERLVSLALKCKRMHILIKC